jgi:hypothetical protein
MSPFLGFLYPLFLPSMPPPGARVRAFDPYAFLLWRLREGRTSLARLSKAAALA